MSDREPDRASIPGDRSGRPATSTDPAADAGQTL